MKKTGLPDIFMYASNVVSIQSHHDDTDIAAGGTVAKLVNEGKKVFYATVTDGRFGTLDSNIPAWKFIKIRKEEQNKAAKILGVEKVIYLDYLDQGLESTLELRNKLVNVIRETKADIVMTHDPWRLYEGNRDHRHTGMMSVEAAGIAHHPLLNTELNAEPYLVQGMFLFRPFTADTWVDITDTIDLKLKAICQHQSQFGESIAELTKQQNAEDGKIIKRPYAEVFKILTPAAPYIWKG